jgi:hypothetical protein
VRCAREIVDDLDGREREVIKLRFDLGLEPHEIRARLGLRDRQYRRLIERGTRKVVERVAAVEHGMRSRRQLSLFTACLSGMASERQLAEARSLLETDPKARAVLRVMRRSARRAAVALPLPVWAGAAPDAGRTVGELASAAKQHALSAYVRVSDPTPLSAARPGTLAAAVAGCVAVGGGTYCAVQGVPDPIKPALGIEQTSKKAEVEKPQPPEPSHPAPPQAPAPAPPPPSPTPSPPPPPVSAPPQPQPQPQREFFEQPPAATSGVSPQPLAPPRSAPPPAGGGEFAP